VGRSDPASNFFSGPSGSDAGRPASSLSNPGPVGYGGDPMSASAELHLHEELMLLALRDEKGTVATGTWIDQALGGALLAELMLEGRVRLTGAGSKATARLVKRTPTGNALLDEAAGRIAESSKDRKLTHWVSKFSGLKKLRHRAAEGLCERGILRSGTEKVLLFFERRVYPERDHRPEEALVERLRSAIFGSGEVDARTAVLVALSDRTSILRVVFDRKDLKERKDRIRRITEGEAVAQATREVVESLQTAIIVAAVIVPTVT
jgi:Golgi phosphoprotein 3